MNTTSPIKRPLTFNELLAVRRAVNSSTNGLEADVKAVCSIFDHTIPQWRTITGFRPADVQIPARQAKRIMDWATAHHQRNDSYLSGLIDIHSRLGGLLDIWVNKGPSTYDEPTPQRTHSIPGIGTAPPPAARVSFRW